MSTVRSYKHIYNGWARFIPQRSVYQNITAAFTPGYYKVHLAGSSSRWIPRRWRHPQRSSPNRSTTGGQKVKNIKYLEQHNNHQNQDGYSTANEDETKAFPDTWHGLWNLWHLWRFLPLHIKVKLNALHAPEVLRHKASGKHVTRRIMRFNFRESTVVLCLHFVDATEPDNLLRLQLPSLVPNEQCRQGCV